MLLLTRAIQRLTSSHICYKTISVQVDFPTKYQANILFCTCTTSCQSQESNWQDSEHRSLMYAVGTPKQSLTYCLGAGFPLSLTCESVEYREEWFIPFTSFKMNYDLYFFNDIKYVCMRVGVCVYECVKIRQEKKQERNKMFPPTCCYFNLWNRHYHTHKLLTHYQWNLIQPTTNSNQSCDQ